MADVAEGVLASARSAACRSHTQTGQGWERPFRAPRALLVQKGPFGPEGPCGFEGFWGQEPFPTLLVRACLSVGIHLHVSGTSQDLLDASAGSNERLDRRCTNGRGWQAGKGPPGPMGFGPKGPREVRRAYPKALQAFKNIPGRCLCMDACGCPIASTGEQIDRRTEGWTDGRTDRQTDRHTNTEPRTRTNTPFVCTSA